MQISVVTAVFNRAGTIRDAMTGVQLQSYPHVEHVIQDGGSNDGTLEEIAALSNEATRLVSERDGGIYDAINRGISRASGDIIGLMHSDDFFADHRVLEKVAAQFADPEVDGVYGDLQYVSASDPTKVVRQWTSGEYDPSRLARGWMPPHPTLYLRREVFERFGLYDTSFSIAADYDAMLRYLTKGQITLAYIPEVMVKMRLGGESNRSLERIIRKSREDYRAIRNNQVGGIGTLAAKNFSKIGQFFVKEQKNSMTKVALITGITGQDGSYLAELLLEKGYEVHGIKRRASSFNTQRIDHIYQDPHEPNPKLKLHYGDLTDSSNLTRIIQQVKPDEIYNLGAQSHVAVSFEAPEYTADVDGMGTLRLLEAIRFLGLEKKTRYYQASTSELYGLVQETPQRETTPFYPRSPYAVAKLYAYWIAVNYREAYGMYACNGILFNHESPRRGETFVTRKITRGLANISQGLEDCLYMGNMDALRDWGHAKDYVRMQWMMLQQDKPEDFVIATGKQYSVREFITWSAEELGITLRFEGEGLDEVGIVDEVKTNLPISVKPGDTIVRVDPRYFRPAEVETLLGDPTKAREVLGWEPEITAREMCAEMVAADLEEARRHAFLNENGFPAPIMAEI